MRFLRSTTALAVTSAVLLAAGAALLVAPEPAAAFVPGVTSQAIRDEAASHAEGSYGGQCKGFVNNVFAAVASRAGSGATLGNGYYAPFINAGGVEVSAAEAVPGDIIQLNKDSDRENYYPGMHSAIINVNKGGGNFGVIDSNRITASFPDGDEQVHWHDWNPYTQASQYGLGVHIWRMGTSAVNPPSGTQQSRNLLANASFEKSANGWNKINLTGNVNYVAYQNAARAHDGDGFLEMNTSVLDGSVYQDVPASMSPGESYTFSVWMRSPSGTPISGRLALYGMGGAQEGCGTDFTVGPQWTLVSVPLDVANVGHTQLRAQVYMKTTGANYNIDGATFARGNAGCAPADAVIAAIDSVTPLNSTAGQSVAFAGHGTDSVGHAISAYQWRSSRDGILSESKSFSSTRLSVGSHVVYFKARCANGQWSSEQQVSLVVAPAAGGTIPVQTTLALSSKSAPILGYGSTFKVSGTLMSSTGLVGHRVILQSMSPGATYRDTSYAATTTAGGVFTFSVKLKDKTYYRVRFAGSDPYTAAGPTGSVYAKPRSYVRTPIAPKAMRRTKYYAVYGWLKPKHKSGTYPVRIYKWKRASTGRWKSYGYVNARASNYSTYTKYSKRIRLSEAGSWRLRAYVPADSKHSANWSKSYDYVTVK